ncbi:MAG: hypothetical protein NVS4B9_29820 [Ktedonobacteraceae bacterium]
MDVLVSPFFARNCFTSSEYLESSPKSFKSQKSVGLDNRSDTVYKSYVDRSDGYGFITLEIFFYLYSK